jgi:hypothetical protein
MKSRCTQSRKLLTLYKLCDLYLNFLSSHRRDYSSMYWKSASVDQIVEEYAGQRQMMSHFGKIPMADLNGMRLPMFQKSGNASYEALVLAGLTYDSSWTTQEATAVWPYSLDYASVQDCPMGSCPRASIPGAWVVPVIDWIDTEGVSCSMIDTCVNLCVRPTLKIFSLNFTLASFLQSRRQSR